MSDDTNAPKGPGKRGKPHKPGNTDANGNYIVGKGRTPKATWFVTGDGRKRGRRPKGTPNESTILDQELNSLVPMMENGKKIRVTKLHSIHKRQLDNCARGQNSALALFYNTILPRYEAAKNAGTAGLPADDLAIIREFMDRELGLLRGETTAGDPETDPVAEPTSNGGDSDHD